MPPLFHFMKMVLIVQKTILNDGGNFNPLFKIIWTLFISRRITLNLTGGISSSRFGLWGLSTSLSVLALLSASSHAASTTQSQVAANHFPQAEHQEQWELYLLSKDGQNHEAFERAFELGDELFETSFNILDGVGANVGDGQRFSRVPRADLANKNQWANHFPARETGPNGQACNSCHNTPFDDGSGMTNSNVHRDPLHTGQLNNFIIRNTSHIFGSGALQRLAEEMTEELQDKKSKIQALACARKRTVERNISAKRIAFGRLAATPVSIRPCKVEFDTSKVSGVDADLIVRPYEWKGVDITLRRFNRGASHNELGMQPVELVGSDVDGDFDGVTNEFTVGDITALTIYLAAQPRPTSKLELEYLGLIEPLTKSERRSIFKGRKAFASAGCTSCHTPGLLIDNPTFSEPSQSAYYQETKFPSGQRAVDAFVDPEFPVSFDLTYDQPDNIVTDPKGREYRLGALQKNRRGQGIARLYSDLKRHDMGPALAEKVDPNGVGESVWLTKELWGVGSTAPYLHDGRASTLTEAILLHGGEAAKSAENFQRLSKKQQLDLIIFLENLVLFKLPEE